MQTRNLSVQCTVWGSNNAGVCEALRLSEKHVGEVLDADGCIIPWPDCCVAVCVAATHRIAPPSAELHLQWVSVHGALKHQDQDVMHIGLQDANARSSWRWSQTIFLGLRHSAPERISLVVGTLTCKLIMTSCRDG